MATPSARGMPPTPPDRGSFPLDHDGFCRNMVKEYMDCLAKHTNNSRKCRKLQGQYMKCRMSNNLMASENLSNLGYKDTTTTKEEKKKE